MPRRYARHNVSGRIEREAPAEHARRCRLRNPDARPANLRHAFNCIPFAIGDPESEKASKMRRLTAWQMGRPCLEDPFTPPLPPAKRRPTETINRLGRGARLAEADKAAPHGLDAIRTLKRQRSTDARRWTIDGSRPRREDERREALDTRADARSSTAPDRSARTLKRQRSTDARRWTLNQPRPGITPGP